MPSWGRVSSMMRLSRNTLVIPLSKLAITRDLERYGLFVLRKRTCQGWRSEYDSGHGFRWWIDQRQLESRFAIVHTCEGIVVEKQLSWKTISGAGYRWVAIFRILKCRINQLGTWQIHRLTICTEVVLFCTLMFDWSWFWNNVQKLSTLVNQER